MPCGRWQCVRLVESGYCGGEGGEGVGGRKTFTNLPRSPPNATYPATQEPPLQIHTASDACAALCVFVKVNNQPVGKRTCKPCPAPSRPV